MKYFIIFHLCSSIMWVTTWKKRKEREKETGVKRTKNNFLCAFTTAHWLLFTIDSEFFNWLQITLAPIVIIWFHQQNHMWITSFFFCCFCSVHIVCCSIALCSHVLVWCNVLFAKRNWRNRSHPLSLSFVNFITLFSLFCYLTLSVCMPMKYMYFLPMQREMCKWISQRNHKEQEHKTNEWNVFHRFVRI